MDGQGPQYDVLIVGQGAAGFSAALYAARYQMKAVVFGDKFGGETAIGGAIENYPGFPSIDGFDLMLKMREQVEAYGVEIVDEKVDALTRLPGCFEAHTEPHTEEAKYRGRSVILAVGRERRRLGLPMEEEWTGRGVSYCSVCDAPLYRGKTAAVVGGGNAAVEGAILLARYADKAYLVYRGERLHRPEPVTLRMLEDTANVEVLLNTQVAALKGQDGLEGVALDRPVNGSHHLALDGLFVEIGADPRTKLGLDMGVSLNEQGEIVVDKLMRTSVEGVFGAGDLTDASGNLKQTITAAAQGALAATSAYEFVSAHPGRCQCHAMGYPLVAAGT